MDNIELKKEEAAFYFNLALHNLSGLLGIPENKRKELESKPPNIQELESKPPNIQELESKTPSIKDKAIDEILAKEPAVKRLEHFIFNNRNIAKDPKAEMKCLLSKLIELRHYYSHHNQNDSVKILSNGERPLLDKYYQNATEATGSENVKLQLAESTGKIRDEGILFLLCIFLYKSQANQLIGGISGFKRNDKEGQPRRNAFTYYCVRDGYKVIPEMHKHFLLFTLINHLSKQDEYINELKENEEISEGDFFQRIATTFLSISEITGKMKFYNYESKKLREQRKDIEPEKDTFPWIEPFQGNSYFKINGEKGVINEDELKDLCYALLAEKQSIGNASGRIETFLKSYKNTNTAEQVRNDPMLDITYFPENYFAKPDNTGIKDKTLNYLKLSVMNYEPKTRTSGNKSPKSAKPLRSYDKMKEVMEFINNSLPAEEKLRQKDYSRYLKMVRFWKSEASNIEREFGAKDWHKNFPGSFWKANTLEDIYKIARQGNERKLRELTGTVEKMKDEDFQKYQQISNAADLAGLKKLAGDFGVPWEEKDWDEYSRQIKKQITERQKLTIMKQRVTAQLKKKQGIQNLNLRITTDNSKSRNAVVNRIAIPKDFVKKHILGWGASEKIPKKIRQAECNIQLSPKYEELSKKYSEKKDWDKLSQLNGLYEKNKIIALMAVYIIEKSGMKSGNSQNLENTGKMTVAFKIGKNKIINISLNQYPSLTYAINKSYADKIDSYPFADREKGKQAYTFLEKIKVIEKERMDFIDKVLKFEEYLYGNEIIDKNKFSDPATHPGFYDICKELENKGWDKIKLDKLRKARNASLHGNIPETISFRQAGVLINELKNRKI